mmetsp:Transcript_8619/g.12858  ORF Transcript_8619/g.12858 Transcript_8619/m.12858 type:complete len:98 (-) Transcript_8619:34-327(-)
MCRRVEEKRGFTNPFPRDSSEEEDNADLRTVVVPVNADAVVRRTVKAAAILVIFDPAIGRADISANMTLARCSCSCTDGDDGLNFFRSKQKLRVGWC